MVWSLSPGEVSNIIETDYGFHLVAVDSVRSSEFAEYDTSSYEYAALRSSLVSVRDLLKDASFAYDREVLDERVLFYWSEVEALFFLIRDEKILIFTGALCFPSTIKSPLVSVVSA